MSIRDVINQRVRDKRLFELAPSLPSDPHRRTIFMSQEVNELVWGPWTDQKSANRGLRLRANLEEFVKGELLTVCLKPYKHEDAYMGRLDRPIDEVWDIRSRSPKPGLRVFGRFSERNTFIALHWEVRKVLSDRRAWGFAIAETKARWNRLLAPAEPPFRGEDNVDVYLCNAYSI